MDSDTALDQIRSRGVLFRLDVVSYNTLVPAKLTKTFVCQLPSLSEAHRPLNVLLHTRVIVRSNILCFSSKIHYFK